MKKFLKGIIIGLGGVSPGLSGSVLMVVFDLYEKTIEAIGTFFKKPIENIKYLFPLFCGIGIGVLIFGKIVSYLLENHEMYTRFTFLGLVLGTLPLFYREVRKNGFEKKYYYIIIGTLIIGLLLMLNQSSIFASANNLSVMQSIFLGTIIAASTIIPGVDSAVILSSLGLYEIYVNSVADMNLSILIPALVGVGIGVLFFSMIINSLLKKHYTLTYSLIFGLFLSIIPSVIDKSYNLGLNLDTFISILLLLVGFAVSYNIEKLRKQN